MYFIHTVDGSDIRLSTWPPGTTWDVKFLVKNGYRIPTSTGLPDFFHQQSCQFGCNAGWAAGWLDQCILADDVKLILREQEAGDQDEFDEEDDDDDDDDDDGDDDGDKWWWQMILIRMLKMTIPMIVMDDR